MPKKRKDQLVIWKLNDSLYGIDVLYCKEVQKDMVISPVPFSKKYIRGMVNYRGETSIVYNLDILLEKEITNSKQEIIIRLITSSEEISVLADSIIEIIPYEKSNLQDSSSYLSILECNYISKLYETEFGIVRILDIDKLMEKSYDTNC